MRTPKSIRGCNSVKSIKATPVIGGRYAKEIEAEAMSKPSEASKLRNKSAYDLVRRLRTH